MNTPDIELSKELKQGMLRARKTLESLALNEVQAQAVLQVISDLIKLSVQEANDHAVMAVKEALAAVKQPRPDDIG